MSVLGLVKSGFQHVLRGDLRTPLIWLLQKLTEDADTNETVVVDKNTSVPDWIESHKSALVVQQGNRYFTSLPDTFSDGIRLSTDESFDVLEFGIGNSSRIESVAVDVEFSDGEKTERKEVIFKNGLYDEELNYVPVALSQAEQFTEATMSVSDYETKEDETPGQEEDTETLSDPYLTLPSVGSTESRTRPIFLISVDTWRYDHVDAFQPMLDFLGSDATVPDEPRTQGFFTTPSHASMFTSTQPGDHGHVSASIGNIEPMPEMLTTLGEFLAENGYKNSGLVSHTRLLPNYGYGRGFHRYELDNKRPSNWMREEGNARSLVDTTRQWVGEDVQAGCSQPFYFLHLFDPHPPFYPPLPNFDRPVMDFDAIERFLDNATMTADDEDYIQMLEEGIEVDDDIWSEVTTTYREAVEYTGDQLLSLVRHPSQHDILDDSLIVITGDHGYEFGERGFTGAKSLYDANIRQGMIVKPPADAPWKVPERCDTMDILPTIAKEIGEEPPGQCQGTAWQEKVDDPEQPRINERIRMKHYNVAVEIEGVKAIYTYESNYPHRPKPEQIEKGPIREEYYRLASVRKGDFADCGDDIAAERKIEFREVAEEFASNSALTETASGEFVQPSQETEEQLRNLGYK